MQFTLGLLLRPAIGLMLMMKAFNAPDDLAIGAFFLPVLAIYLWNRKSETDRLYGLALPALAFSVSMSVGGYAQHKAGAVLETLHTIGLIGSILSMFWIAWFILFLGGPPKQV